MNLATWLSVVLICSLGAMSPGPSLAVVLRHALSGGRRSGCIAALWHGLGVGLYALLCISGLALVLTRQPLLYQGLQWAGAAWLVWLGWQGLRSRPGQSEQPATAGSGSAARDGFLIVFLNPKIALFFIAQISQVIGNDTSLAARLGYAATAMLIDAGWYLLVACLSTHPRWLGRLQAHRLWLDRLFGVVLIALAVRLVVSVLAIP
jgi:threonine/homoserine/homoserine lactone efflux protein